MAVARETSLAAYRRGQRWEQRYEPQRLDEPDGVRLRRRGAYLITGGLGGNRVGTREVARAGVSGEAGVDHAGLLPGATTGRSGWTGTPTLKPIPAGIRALLEIEAAGAEILIGVADAADERAMAAAIEGAWMRWGRIDGVIHAAGLPGGGLVQLKTREAAAAVLAPKVKGTRVLEDLLRENPPDFLVLCSSINAIGGGSGAVNYCAANLFLDTFAASPHALAGTHVVAIGWDAWQESGMAASRVVPAHMRKRPRRCSSSRRSGTTRGSRRCGGSWARGSSGWRSSRKTSRCCCSSWLNGSGPTRGRQRKRAPR